MAHQSVPKNAETAADIERVLLGDIECIFHRGEDGEPVVFIHGAAGNDMSWNRAIEWLLAGSQALPLDLLGAEARGQTIAREYDTIRHFIVICSLIASKLKHMSLNTLHAS